MFSTSITRTFKLTTPIVNAGMAMIARPALAAAVCEAGGLGTIGRSAASRNLGRPLWATVFATALLGVIGLGVVALLERILLRWHVSQRRTSAVSARGLRRWVP